MDFQRNIMDFQARLPALKARCVILNAIRSFFTGLEFTEVSTMILQTMPGADVHIHAFATDQMGVDLAFDRRLYLHNSPEFAMKKILVAGDSAGLHKIFQITPVFRNGEGSKLHKSEFTMIEWYRAHDGYETIMRDCENLLSHVARAAGVSEFKFAGKTCDAVAAAETLRVRDAFLKFCGFDLAEVLNNRDAFAARASACGVNVRDVDLWDDIFHAVMAQKIEPNLGCGAPVILYEYPAHMAALSRICDDDKRFAKRFELYVCGVELANAFDELTDATEQRVRFTADMEEKARIYGTAFPIDEEFLAGLEAGLPRAGGIALGVDRLIMLCTNAQTIDDVLWWGDV